MSPIPEPLIIIAFNQLSTSRRTRMIGKTLGHYQITSQIGKGGIG
jgi:hypothetical protein